MATKQKSSKKRVKLVDRQLVGHVTLDSGIGVIGDPSNLSECSEHEIDGSTDACAVCWSSPYAPICAVVVHTGLEDGPYPVYVTTVRDSIGRRRIAGIYIDFEGSGGVEVAS